MPNNGYFDIRRDREIINAGGFFCRVCLVGKPASEISPDPRYCSGCYDFLLKEAAMLPRTKRKRPEWIPSPKETAQVSQDMRTIMSTLESKKSEVDIIHPMAASRATGKRGPKQRQLPVGLIMQLNIEDLGAKAIASWLKRERGIEVSYKTIQRILSGERK